MSVLVRNKLGTRHEDIMVDGEYSHRWTDPNSLTNFAGGPYLDIPLRFYDNIIA